MHCVLTAANQHINNWLHYLLKTNQTTDETCECHGLYVF